ncbi:MAG: hypothetical protein U0M06_03235 [Clostridia bacterium]|nr:hypothetical protein [Clostridia bacterium]
MTEKIVIPNLFAPMRGCEVTCDTLICGRSPSAISKITSTTDKKQIGQVEFYSTPAGIVVNAVISSLPSSKECYEPVFIEISESSRNAMYKMRSRQLPPLYVKKGSGKVSFLTDRFSASELVGRSLVMKKCGDAVAVGDIVEACNRK